MGFRRRFFDLFFLKILLNIEDLALVVAMLLYQMDLRFLERTIFILRMTSALVLTMYLCVLEQRLELANM